MLLPLVLLVLVVVVPLFNAAEVAKDRATGMLVARQSANDAWGGPRVDGALLSSRGRLPFR